MAAVLAVPVVSLVLFVPPQVVDAGLSRSLWLVGMSHSVSMIVLSGPDSLGEKALVLAARPVRGCSRRLRRGAGA